MCIRDSTHTYTLYVIQNITFNGHEREALIQDISVEVYNTDLTNPAKSFCTLSKVNQQV